MDGQAEGTALAAGGSGGWTFCSHVYSQPRGGRLLPELHRGCVLKQSEQDVGQAFAVPVRQAGTWGPLQSLFRQASPSSNKNKVRD